MTEKERLLEIAELANRQLSHATDLPPKGRVWDGKRDIYVTEVPYADIDDFASAFVSMHGCKKNYYASTKPPSYPCRLYIREWMIERSTKY